MFLNTCRSKCKEHHVSGNFRSIHKKNLRVLDIYQKLYYQNKSDTGDNKFGSRRNKRFLNGKKEVANGTIQTQLSQASA